MSRSEDKKTAAALLSGGLRHVAATLAGLLTYPLVARLIGAEGLGAWTLLGTANFLLNISDLGVTTAVQRAAVGTDHALARRMIAFGLFVIALAGPIFALLGYFLLIEIPGESPALRADVARAAAVVLLAGVVSANAYPYRGFVFARGGVAAVAKARTAGSMTQLVTTAGGFLVARSLLVPAFGLLAGGLVELTLTAKAARAIDPEVPLVPRLPSDRNEIRTALRDGAASLVIGVATFSATRVDVVVLSRFAPLAVVAAYGVALRAVDILYLLAKQATVALMPRLGDPDKRHHAVRIGTGIYCGVVGCGMAAMAVNGQGLLVGWVGEVAKSQVTAIALGVLASAAILASGEELAGAMLSLAGRTAWGPTLPIVAGSAVNLVISVGGAPRYGVWAVAGSTVVGNAIMTSWMWLRARKVLGWSFFKVLEAFAPPALGGLLSLILSLALAGFAKGGFFAALVSVITATATGCGFAAALLWYIGQKPPAQAAPEFLAK